MIWIPRLEFSVPGQPVAKARPRFSRTTNGVRVRTDKRTKAHEVKVALLANQRRDWRGLLARKGVAVRVDILAIFERPKYMRGPRYPAGLIPHTVRPDSDNVAKAILDGLTKCARVYDDDGQASCIRVDKFYAEKGQGPRTIVRVYVPKVEKESAGDGEMDTRAAGLDTEDRESTPD